MSTPYISILCLTYNHASFIRQALDGFLMQKTSFPFEVLIHDDASTDGTQEIIREYVARYPEIIKPVYQTENQWQKGVPVSKKFQFPRVRGKYVAMCEGDDYWTDPLKLQKQVDFLDGHPDYSVCFHPVRVLWENDPGKEEIFPLPEARFHKTTLTADDLIQQNFIQTNSVVYRWAFPEFESLDDYPEGILPGDWYLHLIHAKHGKIGFLEDTMSVYRRHEGGIWQNRPVLRYGLKHMRFYEEVDKLFDFRFHEQIQTNKSTLIRFILQDSIVCDEYRQLMKIGAEYPLPKELFRNIIISHQQFSIRHRLINRIAKFLGLGAVYVDNWWIS